MEKINSLASPTYFVILVSKVHIILQYSFEVTCNYSHQSCPLVFL
uniref:Uncharacterized protein n=1 Tax=Rhizophora mucronata TaxID=61149 RepID=A0A2P2P913_RHIMU